MLERVSAGRAFGLLMPAIRNVMLSDRALEERVDLMLNALAPLAEGPRPAGAGPGPSAGRKP
jgi:hypothetical protein